MTSSSLSSVSSSSLINDFTVPFNSDLSIIKNNNKHDDLTRTKTLNNYHNKFSRQKNNSFYKKKNKPGIYAFFTASQYSAITEPQVQSIEPAYKQCFDEVVRTYMEEVNKISRNMCRFLEYKNTFCDYYKYQPQFGMNYILDLFLIYRKLSGKKVSASVRKHVYVVQKFCPLYFRELSSAYSSAILSSSGAGSPYHVNLTSPVTTNINTIKTSSSILIHIIVPVSGRLSTLKRLLTNFHHVVMHSNDTKLLNLHLHAILMETSEDSDERMSTIVDYIKKFIENHQASRIHLTEVRNENFTCGYASSYGSSHFNDTDLLFFIYFDMAFIRDLFPRIHAHTIFS
ncbi:unnamed protein product [Rotaria sp. Silwood2]|nr:unnamed protein product [Rotaria sp. Silwood2]CAF4204792.1 unnamed protein product [Rotaria sp. Silwood2]